MSDAFRVVVFGGRKYGNIDAVYRALDSVHKRHGDLVVVHGGATGADAIAAAWAKEREVRAESWPAKWRTHGRPAGPIRNAQMASSGLDGAIEFPGNSGTKDMREQCEKWNVGIWRPC